MTTTMLAIAALAALSFGALFYALVYPYLSGEVRAEKRKEQLAQGSQTVRQARDRAAEIAGRRKQVSESLKEIEEREKKREKVSLEDRITQAGLDWTPRKFYIIGAISALVCAIAIIAVTGMPLAGLFGLVAGGLGIPNWLLGHFRNQRIKKFLEEFPNAIDVIVRGIKSGLPLNDCVRIIATEAKEPVRGEFRAIVEAQSMGMSISDACARMAVRMPTSEANFFAIVIQIQQKAGGNLSEALGNLSRVLRERKKMKGKIKAISAEAKASAWVIGAMPIVVAIMTYFANPAYISLMWTTQTGQLVLVVCAFIMALGILIMKNMINFDI